eukprot:CAMPEP_0118935278 /NCGR_PEP_ID=MMETSP1169-20130426/15331_1 /TAXON_ID=36882 /ORGANISM="Pyramimonas obovata, Strain CCMP722" /LENGTH=267 /DNA_ID=CAMNT_0006878289 /DNA_START=82 /DNA_END=882 /DNA_ORIENTATION=-
MDRDEEFMQAARRGQRVTLERLLVDGVPVDSTDRRNGRTALLYAAAHGEKKCVEVLLSNGADVRRTTSAGDNALHLAAQSTPFGREAPRVYVDLIQLLLEAGTDRCAVNSRGLRPIDLTHERDTALRELLKVARRESESVDTSASSAEPRPVLRDSQQPTLDSQPEQQLASPKPPKPLVALQLPHPSVHASLCSTLWDRAAESPDTTARTCMAVIDEVLEDSCMDNMPSTAFERIFPQASQSQAGGQGASIVTCSHYIRWDNFFRSA